ncbi:cobalamin biosynthesis protein [Pseudorhodobacter aquimaris]|uniref:cobalamin biosynthesis protein n=1 Tax=Pseudorhodobacter aquimaris TaxID=687412 RepID=UPI00067E41D6|nr:cobalamin biosynthesis protein [Pseudorhodobacter aquimaris]
MIVAGFGFRTGVSAASLYEALMLAMGGHRPDCLATAADKAQSAAFQQLVTETGLPFRAIPARDLAAINTPTQSAAAQTSHGTGSVAEAAALAAAGPQARLLAPRIISTDRQATCALAMTEDP